MAPHPEITTEEQALSPMAIRDLSTAKTLIKRANDAYMNMASAGSRPANDLAGPGFQALFALIGIGMTLTALWFFFWAKNGGFKWRGKDDWEDYKSTVLRRKGPDGKTLSNATKSTRLGGGSVVHGGSYGAESSIGFTDETGTSADFTEYRDAEEGKGKGGLRGGDGRVDKKKSKSNPRRDHTNNYNDPELRDYRNEKAARVGGLNRQADGMYTDYSGSQPSELGSNVSSAPLVKKSENKDPKKEAKEKERRAKERMKKAKLAEKEAAKTKAAEAKQRREEQKVEAKREKEREKEAYRKNKKTKSVIAPSEAPEMAEVTRALTEYTSPQTEYTRAYTEYTAPSEAGTPSKAPQGPRRAPPSAAYSFTTGEDDNQTVFSGAYTDNSPQRRQTRTERSAPTVSAVSEANESSYYSDYRPNADPSAFPAAAKRESRSASRPRERPQGSRSRPESRTNSQSPQKRHRDSQSARPNRSKYAPAPSANSDIFTAANGESRGHMSYPCHIPGLSSTASASVSPYDSVSQAGAPRSTRGGRDVMDGYRRGGVRAVGRRDSLSDSD